MAKPYGQEMKRLGETFAWASSADVAPLRQAVRMAAARPLQAIGSGGSLSAAHALAVLHRQWTRQLAVVASPLETSWPSVETVSTWLISAGGGNVDILRAVEQIARREPRHVAVMCGREASPLAKFCEEHPYIDALLYPPPAGKDGFLATNSLLGFATLLARAYCEEFGSAEEWSSAAATVAPWIDEGSSQVEALRRSTALLWGRPTTLVLHGQSTFVGAVDLESKFTEAAIGNLQLADYRNFAHGRHHWLAKRGDESGILAFVSEDDSELAERTLRLIPEDIPISRVPIEGSATTQLLGSLTAALRIAGWAGEARGLDPGRPGVPDFGRKLYNLQLPKASKLKSHPKLSDRDAAAIARKAGASASDVAARGDLVVWTSALEDFRERLGTARFRGVVLDYDGTIVDTRRRFEPASDEMIAQLVRLLDAGIVVGIATGRGGSVQRDLKYRLPESLWSRVVVGYYNGAEINLLDSGYVPGGSGEVCASLAAVAATLRHHPELAGYVDQTDRKYQITLTPRRRLSEERLWETVQQIVHAAETTDIRATRSTHSVDVIAPGVSKVSVLRYLRGDTDASILAIGDRGKWPGNDFELLREPLSLSVDEASSDPSTCWNLGDWGQRGIRTTLDYLTAMTTNGGLLGVDSTALR